MNLYKKEIYKKSLQHTERRNHKYIYKIGDRYIYPEDVAGKAKSTANNIGSMATAAGTAAKTKISNTIADQKTKLKDRKFVKSSNPGWSNEGANRQRIETEKRNEERWRKHIQSPEYKQGEYNRKASEIGDKEAYKRMVASNRPGRRKSSELEKQKERVATNKRRIETERQRKSAHAGYEEDRRLFPEGGSTEELERQKEKTTARKTKARTDAAVEEMRKRKKRMDASVEPVKPTRNISGVKPGGKALVKETSTSEKKRRSIDRDDLRIYKKAAGMMLDEGRQNEINRRKERSERTKARNAKMAKEINSDNAKKVGKAILYNSKLGKLVKAGELMDDNRKLKKRKASR